MADSKEYAPGETVEIVGKWDDGGKLRETWMPASFGWVSSDSLYWVSVSHYMVGLPFPVMASDIRKVVK